MNKKLLAMLDKINQKKSEVVALTEEGKLEEAKVAKEELKNLQQRFDLMKDVLDPEGDGQVSATQAAGCVSAGDQDSTHEFANAARNGFRNTMTEGTPADGGYTVPEDIQTRVNEYRQSKASLIDLVMWSMSLQTRAAVHTRSVPSRPAFPKWQKAERSAARTRRSLNGWTMRSASTPDTCR